MAMSHKKLNGNAPFRFNDESVSEVERTFKILDDQGSPCGVRILNDTTLAALHEDMSKKKRYQSVEALLQDLGISA